MNTSRLATIFYRAAPSLTIGGTWLSAANPAAPRSLGDRPNIARTAHRPARELDDLQADPWELANVAERAENAAVIATLEGQLDGWMRQQGVLGDKTECEAEQHQGSGKKAEK